MSETFGSVFDTQDLSLAQVQSIFETAQNIRTKLKAGDKIMSQSAHGRVVALLFFEPSTRTRISFETAALRLGLSRILMDSSSSTSLAKGETLADTLMNIQAMQPDLIVVRSGPFPELKEALKTLPMPFVNGGFGVDAHPTQALLDAFTILQFRPSLKGQKVLFLGDVAHSRVARSNQELLTRLGAEVGFCAPKQWWPKDESWKSIRTFENMNEALKWATVCMGLRVQFERHADPQQWTQGAYHQNFGLNASRLKELSSEALVLHPGPIMFGYEFDRSVMDDKRVKVYDQVENGVYVRAALLKNILAL